MRAFSTGKVPEGTESKQVTKDEDYNLDEVSSAAISSEEEEVAAPARERQQRKKDLTPAERQASQAKRFDRNVAIQK